MSAAITIAHTGVANVASVRAAFHRLGCEVETTSKSEAVTRASRLVIPGVGSFGAAMHRLNQASLTTVLRERILQGRPTLAICAGFQLLAPSSEESPGVPGLGIWDAAVEKIDSAERVPQLGWNEVKARSTATLVQDGHAYYANSYCLRQAPPAWECSFSHYGCDMVGSAERGAVLACQFHPELSGSWGESLLERWMRRARDLC